MKFRAVCFNMILCGAVLAVLPGCSSTGRKKKEASTLRFHVEVPPDRTDRVSGVPVYRAAPVRVEVDKDPFVTEHNVVAAVVLDQPGGHAIQVRLDRQGSWLLERYTVSNKGRRIAIFSEFGEDRWLAAPLITRIISNGTLTFTPDATREEAERIVRGLNNVARKKNTAWDRW